MPASNGDETPVDVDWCVVDERGLHVPGTAATFRRLSYDGAVVESAVRVAGGGDVIQRVYVTDRGVFLDFENASPLACAVGLLVRGPAEFVRTSVAPAQWCEGSTVAAVASMIGAGATARPPVDAHAAVTGLVWPVAHRATLRVSVAAAPDSTAGELPTPDDVRRGWLPHLRRGMRVDVDDRIVQDALDAARIAALVLTSIGDAATVRALEDWGFDAEAALAWERLGTRQRRAARHRKPDPLTAWDRSERALANDDAIGLLLAMRDVVIVERQGCIDLFAGFPPAWLGRNVAFHDAPLRRGGSVSAALRWHGARPALLWESTVAGEMTAPALAPGWSTREPAGEVLLPAPSPSLLGL